MRRADYKNKIMEEWVKDSKEFRKESLEYIDQQILESENIALTKRAEHFPEAFGNIDWAVRSMVEDWAKLVIKYEDKMREAHKHQK